MDSKELHNLVESYSSVYIAEEDTTPEVKEEVDEVDEARAPGVKPYKPGPTQAEVRSGERAAAKKKIEAGKDQPGYDTEKLNRNWQDRATPSSVDRKGRTVSQRMDSEHPYKKRMVGKMGREYGNRTAANVTRTVRGPGEPRAVKLPQRESFDYFDKVLNHLVSEGFAKNEDSAKAIMIHMSEEWIQQIIAE